MKMGFLTSTLRKKKQAIALCSVRPAGFKRKTAIHAARERKRESEGRLVPAGKVGGECKSKHESHASIDTWMTPPTNITRLFFF